MKKLFIIAIVLISACGEAFAQDIPNKSNLIKVKGVSFVQVCNVLLDSGYIIEKKDAELQTATTEMREYVKSYNAAFRMQIRVKDSVVYLYATFTAPWWDPFTKNASKSDPLWKDTRLIYATDKKGRHRSNTLYYYPFNKMMAIAKALGGEVEYLISE